MTLLAGLADARSERMKHWRALRLAFLATTILTGITLSSCALRPTSNSHTGGGSLPMWQFRWLTQNSDIAASRSPQVAFANAGRAEHVQPDGVTDHLPTITIWLASGHTFGVVIVQLDPEGAYWNLVTLTFDPDASAWQANAGDLPRPVACGQGKPFAGRYTSFGAYCTLVPVRSGSIPAMSLTNWTTPHRETFVAGHVAATIERPTSGTTPLRDSKYQSWLSHEANWTIVAAILPDGDSAFFASTGDAQRCQDLAADFLRLGSDLMALH